MIPEPPVPEWIVIGVASAALVLLTSYIYWEGYITGRCHDVCGGAPAVLSSNDMCICEPNYPGTVP